MKRELFVLFILLSLFIFSGCGKKKDDEKTETHKEIEPYKEVAISYLDATVKRDGEKACKMMVPVVVEEEYESLDNCIKVGNNTFKAAVGNITYKIISEKKLTGDEYEEWIGSAADYYGGIGKSNTSEVVEYEAELYLNDESLVMVYFNVINFNNECLVVK